MGDATDAWTLFRAAENEIREHLAGISVFMRSLRDEERMEGGGLGITYSTDEALNLIGELLLAYRDSLRPPPSERREPDWMVCGSCGATRNWNGGFCVGDDGINPVGICDASIKDAIPAYRDPPPAEAVQYALQCGSCAWVSIRDSDLDDGPCDHCGGHELYSAAVVHAGMEEAVRGARQDIDLCLDDGRLTKMLTDEEIDESLRDALSALDRALRGTGDG